MPLPVLLALLALSVLSPLGPRAASAESDWSNLGLSAYGVRALAIDPLTPTTIFAGTPSGVMRSTDGGSSWSQATTGIGAVPVWSLAIHPLTPTTVFAGTGADPGGSAGGVFRSLNGGASWERLNVGFPSGTFPVVGSLAIDPTNPSVVVAGSSLGLYRSADGGASWTATSVSGVAVGYIRSLTFDPVTPSRLYGFLDRLYRSDDSGRSWAPVSGAPSSSGSIAISPASATTIYITAARGGPEYGVFRSTDGGTTFQRADSGLGDLFVTSLLADPRNANTVYAGTDFGGAATCAGGVYRSTDGGGSWSHIGPVFTCSALDITALAFAPGDPDTIYAASGSGLYRSSSAATITEQPLNHRVRPGTAVTLDVIASGGSVSYQWYRGMSSDTSQPIADATSRTYTTQPLSSDAAYWVQLTNSAGQVNSRTAQVSIKGAYDPILDGFNAGSQFDNFSYAPGNAIPGASWEIFKRTFPANTMETSNGQARMGAAAYFRSQAYRSLGSGNCFGMSAVSVLRYLDNNDTLERSTLNPYYRRFTQVGDLPPGVDGSVHVGQSNVKDYIFLYQGRQRSVQIAAWFSRHSLDTPAQTFEAIRQITQAGNVALLVFWYQYPNREWGGHAVVAYGVQQTGASGTIAIYDPNAPGDTSRRLSVDLTPGRSRWSYELWPGTTWSGDRLLKYLPVNMLFPAFLDYPQQQAVASLQTEESGVMIGVEGGADLRITDSQGRSIGAELLDPAQEIPGALRLVNFSFNPEQPNATSPEAYYLPAGQPYTVTVHQPAGVGLTAAEPAPYMLTAFGDGSVMTVSGASLSGMASDTLVLGGTPRDVTFTPAVDGDYCQALTDEVSDDNSREYRTCVTNGAGVPARFTIDQASNAFSVSNTGASSLGITIDTTQVGTRPGTGTGSDTLSPGGLLVAPEPRSPTYLPFIGR